MNRVAQLFEHLVTAFGRGRHSKAFRVFRIGFIGEVRMYRHPIEVAIETGGAGKYPVGELNAAVRGFGVNLYRRRVAGTDRYRVVAEPIWSPPLVAIPRHEVVPAVLDPAAPPAIERECLACDGMGEMEARWSAVPGQEALPCHECFVCEGAQVVLLCSGCNEQLEADRPCTCFSFDLAVAA